MEVTPITADEAAKIMGQSAEDGSLNTETPTTETPSEVSQEVSEANTEKGTEQPQSETTETVNAEPVKSFEEIFRERTGFDYSDQIVEKLNAEPEEFDSSLVEANRFMRETGYDFESYVTIQSLDPSKMTKEDMIQTMMLNQDDGLEEDDVESYMRLKYRMDEWHDNPEDYPDGVEPRDITLAKFEFNKDAKKASQFIESLKSKYAAPKVDRQEEEAANLEQRAKEYAEWDREAKNTVQGLNKISFKVNNKEAFDFLIDSKEEKESLGQFVSDLYNSSDHLWDMFKGEDGNISKAKLAEGMYWLKNKDRIAKTIYDQAFAKGAETIVKEDLKNADFKPNAQNGSVQIKSIEEQISEQFPNGF